MSLKQVLIDHAAAARQAKDAQVRDLGRGAPPLSARIGVFRGGHAMLDLTVEPGPADLVTIAHLVAYSTAVDELALTFEPPGVTGAPDARAGSLVTLVGNRAYDTLLLVQPYRVSRAGVAWGRTRATCDDPEVTRARDDLGALMCVRGITETPDFEVMRNDAPDLDLDEMIFHAERGALGALAAMGMGTHARFLAAPGSRREQLIAEHAANGD